jgi:hydroxymethylbilane synthase
MQNIQIGTRNSKLALWQANHIAALLKRGGLEAILVPIETQGDKKLEVSIAKIGSKGVFTQELDELLQTGEIDIAVHSAKDMQSQLPEGFEIIAFTEREMVNDVLINETAAIDLQRPGLVIGTSSTRRIAQLKHYFPHIHTVPVRGNLQTRLRKLKEGACDALMLAYAGVHRMEFHPLIAHRFSTDTIIPAVGQGSVAVQCAQNLAPELKQKIRELTNHPGTEKTLLAERAYLRTMEGGCSVPVFALAHLTKDQVHIRGGVVSLDGTKMLIETANSSIDYPEEAGQILAERIIARGGGEILKEIKSSNH